MKLIKALPALAALMFFVSACGGAPEPTPTVTPVEIAPAISSTPLPEASSEPSVVADTSQYDVYYSARRQITRHYSEYVSNYAKTFGSSPTVQLPIDSGSSSDPYINISIPVLIDVDRGALDQVLKKPLDFSNSGDALSTTYARLYTALAPLETAYKAARDYYLDGDAQEDGFGRSQALHDAMISASNEYTASLDAFSDEMRVLEKLRRAQTLQALLDAGQTVRYQVESMLAYGGDIKTYLEDYDDENPFYKGDAEAFRPYRDEFVKFADAVLEYTIEDLQKDGFNADFSHMFPSFFTCVMKMRIIADNILIIMEAGDISAPLPSLPPDIDNLGMDPEQALESFADNYSTASKLYSAFIAEEE